MIFKAVIRVLLEVIFRGVQKYPGTMTAIVPQKPRVHVGISASTPKPRACLDTELDWGCGDRGEDVLTSLKLGDCRRKWRSGDSERERERGGGG